MCCVQYVHVNYKGNIPLNKVRFVMRLCYLYHIIDSACLASVMHCCKLFLNPWSDIWCKCGLTPPCGVKMYYTKVEDTSTTADHSCSTCVLSGPQTVTSFYLKYDLRIIIYQYQYSSVKISPKGETQQKHLPHRGKI